MHEPRHAQTGHTWHKFALSGPFSGLPYEFIHLARKTRSQAEFVRSTVPILRRHQHQRNQANGMTSASRDNPRLGASATLR